MICMLEGATAASTDTLIPSWPSCWLSGGLRNAWTGKQHKPAHKYAGLYSWHCCYCLATSSHIQTLKLFTTCLLHRCALQCNQWSCLQVFFCRHRSFVLRHMVELGTPARVVQCWCGCCAVLTCLLCVQAVRQPSHWQHCCCSSWITADRAGTQLAAQWLPMVSETSWHSCHQLLVPKSVPAGGVCSADHTLCSHCS